MSTGTLERPAVENPILQTVDTSPVYGEDVSQEFETPGERVRNTFDSLWKMYEGRRAGLSFSYGNEVTEEDILATRYYDQAAIEEIYLRSRTYDVSGKPSTAMKETILIHVATDIGSHEIRVDEDGVVHVRASEVGQGDDWYVVSDPDIIQKHLDELFHRTLIAAGRHSERSPEERKTADASALALLGARMPRYVAPKAYDE